MEKYVIDLQSKKNYKKIFSQRLLKAMKRRGLSERDLYNLLYPDDSIPHDCKGEFVTRRTRKIANWVNGTSTPKDCETLLRLCNVLQCDIEYLFSDKLNSDCLTHEIQFIHDKTGLSPKAIEELEDLWEIENNNDPSPRVEMLSILIERPEFVPLLSAILDTNTEFDNLMSHAISEAEKNGHNTKEFREGARRFRMDDINKLSRAFTYSDYKTARYGILQNISNMIDEINVTHDGKITRQNKLNP